MENIIRKRLSQILKADLPLKRLKRNLGNGKANLVHIGYVKRASNGLDLFSRIVLSRWKF